jgi:hypothetical protein
LGLKNLFGKDIGTEIMLGYEQNLGFGQFQIAVTLNLKGGAFGPVD